MLERGKMERGVFEIIDTESLMPQEHLLRGIDAAVDFDKIYDMVEPMYCQDTGRPGVDPVVLFKLVLLQHLYGLSSLRRTVEEARANLYFRWFLGYRIQEEIPHPTTISHNFRHRYTAETVNAIFNWILSRIAEAGYLSPGAVYVDGTRIKGGADLSQRIREEIPAAAQRYAQELMEEVNPDQAAPEDTPIEEPSPVQPYAAQTEQELAAAKARIEELTQALAEKDRQGEAAKARIEGLSQTLAEKDNQLGEAASQIGELTQALDRAVRAMGESLQSILLLQGRRGYRLYRLLTPGPDPLADAADLLEAQLPAREDAEYRQTQ